MISRLGAKTEKADIKSSLSDKISVPKRENISIKAVSVEYGSFNFVYKSSLQNGQEGCIEYNVGCLQG